MGQSLPESNSSMSRFTVHSKSTSLGLGPEGPPPPPPPPPPPKPPPPPLGGATGPVVTVMITSTLAVALASLLPSSASTVTSYVSCMAISTLSATLIWPLTGSISNAKAPVPKRLYVSVSPASMSVAVTVPTMAPASALSVTRRAGGGDANSGESFTASTVTLTRALALVNVPSEAV